MKNLLCILSAVFMIVCQSISVSQSLINRHDMMLIDDNYFDAITIVASSDIPLVAIGTANAPIQITNTSTGKRVYVGTPQTAQNDFWETFTLLGFSHSGTSLWSLTYGNSKGIKAAVSYNTTTGAEQIVIPARSAYLSQNGGLLFYDTENRTLTTVTVYNTQTNSIVDSIQFPAAVYWMLYPEKGSEWYVRLEGDSNNTFRVYSKSTNTELRAERFIQNSSYMIGDVLDKSSSGKFTAVAATPLNISTDYTILIIDNNSKAIVHISKMKSSAALFQRKATFSPDEKYFTYPIANKVVTVHLNDTSKRDTTLFSVALMSTVQWLNDSKSFVASNGLTSIVHNFDAKRNTDILTMDDVFSMRFFDHDTKLMIASDKTLKAVDLKEHSIVWQTENGEGVHAQNFAMNTKHDIAAYSLIKTPNMLQIHTLSNETLNRRMISFASPIKSVRISNEAKHVIVALTDVDFRILNLETSKQLSITVNTNETGLVTISDMAVDDDNEQIILVFNAGVLCYSLSGELLIDNKGRRFRQLLAHSIPLRPKYTMLYGKTIDCEANIITGKNQIGANTPYEPAVNNYVTSAHQLITNYPNGSNQNELLYLTLCDSNRIAGVRQNGENNGSLYVWDWKKNLVVLALDSVTYNDNPMAPTPFILSSSAMPLMARVIKQRRLIISSFNSGTTNVHENSGIEQPTFRILPQPANEMLHIFLPEGIKEGRHCVSMYNVRGEMLTTLPFENSSCVIDTHTLSSGVYMVKIQLSDGKVFNKQIIVTQ